GRFARPVGRPLVRGGAPALSSIYTATARSSASSPSQAARAHQGTGRLAFLLTELLACGNVLMARERGMPAPQAPRSFQEPPTAGWGRTQSGWPGASPPPKSPCCSSCAVPATQVGHHSQDGSVGGNGGAQ